MKKMIYLSLLFIFSINVCGYAQPAKAYQFKSTTNTPYAELSGATVIPFVTEGSDFSAQLCTEKTNDGHTIIAFSDASSKHQKGIPLGFNFEFAGKMHNSFMINSDGHIILGKADSVIIGFGAPKNLLTSTSFNNQYIIGACPDVSVYGRYNTSVSYKVEGSSPNRVLAVQFKNLGYKTYDEVSKKTSDSASFQIRLYETSNKIEICFGTYYVNNNGAWLAVGLHGLQEDRHLRAPNKEGEAPHSWQNTTFIQSSSSSTALGNASFFPPNLRFVFEMPLPCVAPTQNPTDFKVEASSDAIFANYSLEGVTADGSILLFSEEQELTQKPQNGSYYEVGSTLGNAEVLEFDFDSYPKKDLESNTSYYLHLYTYNDLCKGGPIYNQTPLSQSINTLTSAPENLKITKLGYDNIELSGKTNSKDETMLVAGTTVLGEDHWGNRVMTGYFAIPAADAKVGDTIKDEAGDFAGVVIYKGKSFDNLKLSNLQSNMIYHYAAWSIGEGDKVSSISTNADTITNAKIPFFENFEEMPTYASPYAWEVKEGSLFRVTYAVNELKGNRGMLEITRGKASSSTEPLQEYLITPSILMDNEKDVRLEFDVILTKSLSVRPFTESPMDPSKWLDGDSLVFEITEDDGKTYQNLLSITKENAFTNKDIKSYHRLRVPIEGYQGKTCKIRMRIVYNDNSNTLNLKIKNYSVLYVDECDFPWYTYAADSTNMGNQIDLDWWTNGKEENWDIRYQYETSKDVFSDYTEAIRVSAHPYTLKDLPVNTLIKAQIRSVCALGSESQWVDFPIFTSGFVLPFVDDFSKTGGTSSFRPEFTRSWTPYYIALTESMEDGLIDISNEKPTGYTGVIAPSKWRSEDKAENGANNAARFQIQSFMAPAALLAPSLDFGENKERYTLRFDLSVLSDKVDNNTQLIIAVAEGNTKKFLKENILKEYKGMELEDMLGDSLRLDIDVSHLKGFNTIGFLVLDSGKNEGAVNIWIDNFALTPGCLSINGLVEKEVSKTTAKIAWTEIPEVDKWFIKAVSPTETKIHTSTQAEYELSNLLPGTTYQVYVAYLCNEKDTSGWANIEIRTLVDECNPIMNLNVEESTKTSISISWDGDAYIYELAIREADQEVWYPFSTSETSYTFQALKMATTYEMKVRSRCSKDLEDTSAWSSSISALTADITCFAPTALTSDSVFHKSAYISWKGDATSYQVALKLQEELNYKAVAFVDKASYSFSDLKPLTKYTARVRAICEAGDTSYWSEPVNFATVAIPECPVPTNLLVEDISPNSALLKWSAADEVETLSLRSRPTTATSWATESLDGDVREFALSGLNAGTAYVWAVKAACSENRESGWAAQNSFTTTDSIQIEEIEDANFNVYTDGGTIHILNPSDIYVYKVELISATGLVLAQQNIRSSGNIVLPLQLSRQIAVLRIYTTQAKASVYKILIK